MIPVLFSIGPFKVYSFGLMVAFGVLATVWLISRRVTSEGEISLNDALDLVYTGVFSGFLGARLLYVLQNLEYYIEQPAKILMIWEGGLIFYGGVAGALAGIWVATKIKNKISFLAALDLLIPYVALVHAFGRIGCFLNGCCFGKSCSLPWAVKFADSPGPVHPAQLYEAAALAGLFAFLNAQYPKRKFDGQTLALYFMIYGVIRFFMEFVRDNPAFGPLSYNQWISLVIIAAGGLLYFLRKKQHAH